MKFLLIGICVFMSVIHLARANMWDELGKLEGVYTGHDSQEDTSVRLKRGAIYVDRGLIDMLSSHGDARVFGIRIHRISKYLNLRELYFCYTNEKARLENFPKQDEVIGILDCRPQKDQIGHRGRSLSLKRRYIVITKDAHVATTAGTAGINLGLYEGVSRDHKVVSNLVPITPILTTK